jgi:ParB family chromosome partitioning protein
MFAPIIKNRRESQMAKFNINSIMNDPKAKAAQGSARRIPKTIDLADITPSAMNKYGIRDIEEIAANIEFVGLMHPLVVRETGPGKYEIVSGERRYRGLCLLVEDGKAEFSKVACMVETQDDPLLMEFEMISANAQARDLTDYEKTYQAGRVKEILQEMKAQGRRFQGRIREIVAEMFGVSSAQMGRMESINNHLVPEAKEEFSKGNLNMTAAYEASRLPEDQQRQVLEDMRESGGKVPVKTVTAKRERAKESPEKPTIPPRPSVPPPRVPDPEPPALPSGPRVHKLKTWEGMFDAIAEGLKPWEYRLNDRDYQKGDILHLMRYNHVAGEFTGQTLDMVVTFIIHGPAFNVPVGYAIMSIKEAGASGGYETT